MHRIRAWLGAFVPEPTAARRRERALGALGAGLGLFFAEWVSRSLLGEANAWFLAPMGASAVLLFAVPASPLAQPWSIMGGNMLAAVVGVACFAWLGDSGAVATLAAALTIALMFPLRCLHPPGGAVALTAVLGGAQIHALGFGFVALVTVNSATLLLAALVFNNVARRRYPHRAAPRANPHGTADPLPSGRLGFTQGDLDEALEARGELLDISRDDLGEILTDAERRAQRRRFGDLRCADIMARDVVRVGPDASAAEVWRVLAEHKVKALPVTVADRRLVGIVSVHDFFIDSATQRARPSPLFDHATPVADMMTMKVLSAQPDQAVADLVEPFSDGGIHHMPVVDGEGRVVGMITQSDLVAALFRSAFRQRPGSAALQAVAA